MRHDLGGESKRESHVLPKELKAKRRRDTSEVNTSYACTVPSPGVDQSQSQRMLGPLKGAQGKKVNRLTAEGIAKVRRLRRCQG